MVRLHSLGIIGIKCEVDMAGSSKFPLLDAVFAALRELDDSMASILGGVESFLSGGLAVWEIPRCSELEFIFIVSSLYKLYRETGGDELKFLNAKIAQSQVELVAHYRLVHELRTFHQHDLTDASEETTQRLEYCRAWFSRTVEVDSEGRPAGDGAWDGCTKALLSDAAKYLNGIKSFISDLEGSTREYVLNEWFLIRKRALSFGEFDKMASEIAGDIGMEGRNIVTFRNKHYQGIMNALRDQRWDTDMKKFVKDSITAILLGEFPGVILVADDLKALGMAPGRDLGK